MLSKNGWKKQGFACFLGTCVATAHAATPTPTPAPSVTPVATQNTARPLSLKDVVISALQNNAEVKVARAKLDEAESLDSQAISALFPVIDGSVSTTYKKEPLTAGATAADPFNYYSFGITGTMPLLKLSSIGAWRAARKEINVREVDESIVRRDVTTRAVQAFYRLLYQQRQLEVLRLTDQIYEEQLKLMQSRFRIGLEREFAVLSFKTKKALLQPKIEIALNEVRNISYELAVLIGKPELNAVSVVGKLGLPPISELAKGLEGREKNVLELERNHVLQEQLSDKKFADLGKHLPELSAVASFGRASQLKSELFENEKNAWAVGLELKVPLFSGLSSLSARGQFAAQLLQLQMSERQVREQAQLKRINTLNSVETTLKAIVEFRDALKDAQRALEVTQRSYKLGTGTYQDLFTAETTYIDAQNSLIQAEFDYANKVVDYFVARGLPLGHLVLKIVP